MTLLSHIAEMGRDNYNERVLNILNRLDFNGFYTKALDQFSGCATGGGTVGSSGPSTTTEPEEY